MNQNHLRTSVLFEEKQGHPAYSAVMSRDRFKFLCKRMKFSNNLYIDHNWKNDRFAAMPKIFELWNNNLMKPMNPSEYMTLDKTLLASKHQLAFVTYNPRKSAKYGVNFKSVNDARFPYTYRTSVYAGKPQNGAGPFYVQGTDNLVKDLVTSVHNQSNCRGKNFTMD